MPAILERCVMKVMAKGHSKDSAWAICRSSLGLNENGSEDQVEREMTDEELDSKVSAGLMNPEMTQEIKPMTAAYGGPGPQPEGLPKAAQHGSAPGANPGAKSLPTPYGRRAGDQPNPQHAMSPTVGAQAETLPPGPGELPQSGPQMMAAGAPVGVPPIQPQGADARPTVTASTDQPQGAGAYGSAQTIQTMESPSPAAEREKDPHQKVAPPTPIHMDADGKPKQPTLENVPADRDPKIEKAEGLIWDREGTMQKKKDQNVIPEKEAYGDGMACSTQDLLRKACAKLGKQWWDVPQIAAFNPYHDEKGQFSDSPGGGTVKDFTIVSKPSKTSEHADIAYTTNMHNLKNLYAGGFKPEDIKGVYADPAEAHDAANKLLPASKRIPLPEGMTPHDYSGPSSKIDTFHIVTTPTAFSEKADISFSRTPAQMDAQFKGGLRPEEIEGVYSHPAPASAHADRLLAWHAQKPKRAKALYNENHDEQGRFSSGPGGSGEADAKTWQDYHAEMAQTHHKSADAALREEGNLHKFQQHTQAAYAHESAANQFDLARRFHALGNAGRAESAHRVAERLGQTADEHSSRLGGPDSRFAKKSKALFNENHDERGRFAEGPGGEAFNHLQQAHSEMKMAQMHLASAAGKKDVGSAFTEYSNAHAALRRADAHLAHVPESSPARNAIKDAKNRISEHAFGEPQATSTSNLDQAHQNIDFARKHVSKMAFKGASTDAPVSKQATVFFSAPSISPQDKQKVLVGDTVEFPVEARNFTGDNVSLKVEPFPLPPNANFVDNGGGKGVFTYTPSREQIGAYDFVFTASDGIQQLAMSVIVVVEAPPVTRENQPEMKAGVSAFNENHDDKGRFSSGPAFQLGSGKDPSSMESLNTMHQQHATSLRRIQQLEHLINSNPAPGPGRDLLFKQHGEALDEARSIENSIRNHPKYVPGTMRKAKALFNENHDEQGRFSSGPGGGFKGHAFNREGRKVPVFVPEKGVPTEHPHTAYRKAVAQRRALVNKMQSLKTRNERSPHPEHAHAMRSTQNQIDHIDRQIAEHRVHMRSLTEALAPMYKACGLSAERAQALAGPPDTDLDELVFDPINVPEFMVGKPGSFQVSGKDLDGDPVEINAEDGTIPEWAEYDKDTGVFHGTPTEAGSWTCAFILTDGVLEKRMEVKVPVVAHVAASDSDPIVAKALNMPTVAKDIIVARAGRNFVNGTQEFDLTTKDIDGIIANFASLKKHVPLLLTPDHVFGGRRSNIPAAGWVEAMYREGDDWHAKVKFLGDAAVAVMNDQFRGVSIGTVMGRDVHGKPVGECLDHLLITNSPFFPDLNIAAKAANESAASHGPVRYFSSTKGVPSMSDKTPTSDAAVKALIESKDQEIVALQAVNMQLQEKIESLEATYQGATPAEEAAVLKSANEKLARDIFAMKVRALVTEGLQSGKLKPSMCTGYGGKNALDLDGTMTWLKASKFYNASEPDADQLAFKILSHTVLNGPVMYTMNKQHPAGAPIVDVKVKKHLSEDERIAIKRMNLDPDRIAEAPAETEDYEAWKARKSAKESN